MVKVFRRTKEAIRDEPVWYEPVDVRRRLKDRRTEQQKHHAEKRRRDDDLVTGSGWIHVQILRETKLELGLDESSDDTRWECGCVSDGGEFRVERTTK